MSEHRRQFQRVALQVNFHGKGADGSGELIFESTDISAGGTFLKSDLLLEEGELLSLEFTVPGVTRRLRAQAKVAWVRRFPEPKEPAGMGMTFLVMDAEDQGALADHLQGWGKNP
jgi:uncharacterized protein (TIGR02266 family)